MYVVQIVFTAFAGYGLVSFGILKLFWMRFGLHFYLDPGQFDYPAALWVEGAITIAFIVTGLAVLAFYRLFIFALIGFALVGMEYFVLHLCDHAAWQLAIPISLMTALTLVAFSEIVIWREGRRTDLELGPNF